MRPGSRNARTLLPALALTLGPALALASLEGCTCGDDAPVPFHAGGEPTLRPVDPAASLAPLEATTHPDGTRVAAFDDLPIRIDEGSIRASGLFDFDRDGDRDVVVVVIGAPGAAARVLYAERRGDQLAPLVSLGSRADFALEGGGTRVACAPTSASVTPLSSSLVLVGVESHCEDEATPRLSSSWVITGDERPRALEMFELAGRAEGEGLTFAANDRDHDDHDDLEIEVRIATPSTPVTTTLTWMSRAAGLAREGDQPEPALSTLATQARDHVRRTPDEAIATAERAIALRDAICREAERPRFFLGGTRGVPCGTSAAIGRAYAMRAAALARRVQPTASDPAAIDAALAAYVRLDHHGASIREGDRALVRESWLRIASVPPARLVVNRGPEVAAVVHRGPHLSSLAFLDEERLLVRGAGARVLRVQGDALVPDSADVDADDADVRILDPDRARELVAIERSCEGTVIVLAPASGIVDAVTGDRREILVAPRPAPFAATCPTMPEGHRADDDGFVALGWAPSGIVLARGATLTFVPLDASGAPAGAPTVLDAQTPAPAPLPIGAGVANANGYALALPVGVVVVDRGERAVRVYRDEDFALPQGQAIDVALSPSLTRAAWLCGGSVCWADLRASDGVAAEGPTPGSGPLPLPPEQRAQFEGAGGPAAPTPTPAVQ